MTIRDEIIEYLKNISQDLIDEEEWGLDEEPFDSSPECAGRELCPDHLNCGQCRYEYMKGKGWLNEEA